ncbi:HAMP domain-containing sensor histidine kinase [Yeosuana sp. MJ-SS3]|uniref:histidine kinase n=1 Tax=Gilvirhabdus luticola TaxID=3079858 RepID=A0ABU3U616_9FLAO|nr:HAMP domain-containing sensor histidine kinase [Yeosuana sp. MJ-SS3]MDU8885848.1 HAMP domain-containing sensor histidine kinase [Yeosuana sp. MJ-SS3]
MDDSRYRWILYIIIFVILGTIGIQVYWNYKNYLINKQQFVNDVQISLDNAVESYFANLAEVNTIKFAFRGDIDENDLMGEERLDSIMHEFKFSTLSEDEFDSLNIEILDGEVKYQGLKGDSVIDILKSKNGEEFWQKERVFLKRFHVDSISQTELKNLTSKVIVSLSNDSLLLEQIDTLLEQELHRKNLKLDYYLAYKDAVDNTKSINRLSVFKKVNDSLIEKKFLSTTSKSTYLPYDTSLKVYFTNETKSILKRILTGIVLSTLLVLLVISCLFYLLKIIKRQKQLAEVKNDLISNITHEFKTPIATIGVALESIKDFNVIDDKEKTKKYLKMSGDQLSKLNVMVEKLLETATLDSDNLKLNTEQINLVDLVKSSVDRYQIQNENKAFHFESKIDEAIISVDIFHLENAINNVIDNAVKYGGGSILVKMENNSKTIEILISDNGNSLTKVHKDKIFEQFYRIPKGNTHNIKGFGIGLYYTKKIIEKHGGTIQLELNKNLTTIKIVLSYE